MTFITSTITSANPAADLYTALASALSGEGYQLVDTVVISTRTHKVWKCPAANNSAGVDFYLDVAYQTSGTGYLQVMPFEDYNATTHLAFRGAVATSATTLDAPTGSFHGATGYALESAPGGITAATANVLRGGSLPVTSFGYWISVTPDRVIMLTSVDATHINYVGLYTPSTEYAAAAAGGLVPLCVLRLWGTSANGNAGFDSSSSMSMATSSASTCDAALTRVYPSPATSWERSVIALSRNNEALRPKIPSGLATSYPRVGVAIDLWARIGATAPTRYGALKDVYSVLAESNVVRGDTIVLEGDATQWRASTVDTSGKALLFRAA